MPGTPPLLTAASPVRHAQLIVAASGRVASLCPREIEFLTLCTGAALGLLVLISPVSVSIAGLIFLYPQMPTPMIMGPTLATRSHSRCSLGSSTG